VGVHLVAVLVPGGISVVGADVLDPRVGWLQKKGLQRSLSIGLIFGALLIVAAVGMFFLVPVLLTETLLLRDALPGFVGSLPERTELFLGGLHPELAARFKLWYQSQLEPERLRALAEQFTGTLISILAGARAFAGMVVGAVVIPVLTFYFLRDLPLIRGRFRTFLMRVGRPKWIAVVKEMDDVAIAYLRGQLLIVSYLAVAYAIGFITLGVPYGLLIALAGGLLFIIPYLGTVVALVFSTLSALNVHGFEVQAFYPAMWIGFVQLIEAYVVTPRVMSEKVGLSPPAIIIALMIGAELAGIFGMLVAVPAGAMLIIVVKAVWQSFREQDGALL
jgi:predicted PurR-regulated permease PerM